MRDDHYRQNPFQALYVTEALEDADLYGKWFSPRIITGETASLFRQGNTILLGGNGAGKTMLLRLFAPEVHAAFLAKGKGQHPIPEQDHRFIGIGVHMIHAGFGALGRRNVATDPEENLRLWPLIVADIMNYHLVGQLLDALKFLGTTRGEPLARVLGWSNNQKAFTDFGRWLARHDCWYGALKGCKSIAGLQDAVRKRILKYRAFANWNTKRLPRELEQSKTEVAQPLFAARIGLTEHNLLSADVPLMVTFDQYESLIHTDYEIEPDQNRSLGRAFCRVVNSFIASRNPKVSFKIGVRPYSWGRELRALGTDAKLEKGRDFQVVDLDSILSRKENTAAWLFPKFAQDVASRRIAAAHGDEDGERYEHWLEEHLEKLGPDDELESYCVRDPNRLLPDTSKWPPAWAIFIKNVYSKSKFKARMVEVWFEQEQGRSGAVISTPPDSFEKGPWAREWWQKERREAILVQSASKCRQRREYGGLNTVLTLSGSNILVFITLCREIWDYWERAKAKAGSESADTINARIQSQAIWVVSDSWLKKQDEFPGGNRRRDFLTRLGIGIRKALLRDRGLVYPGHTGFSLLVDEYESSAGQPVRQFLDEATDFGALVALPHTTKEKNRRPRRKWYLFPTLCPQFEIPAIRTKEPYYAELKEVLGWISETEKTITLYGPRHSSDDEHSAEQLSLFQHRKPEGHR